MCIERWSTRILRVKAAKSSVIVVGGDDLVCWLQVNTSATILALKVVYNAALMAGVVLVLGRGGWINFYLSFIQILLY